MSHPYGTIGVDTTLPDAIAAHKSETTSVHGIASTANLCLAVHTHAAADTTSGQFAMARLASGTPNGTKFIRDDGTLQNVPSGADGLGPDGDKGDVTVGGAGTTLTIDAGAVTYAKIQDVSSASRLLGRGSAGGAGDTEEIVLGTNLSMSGTTLNAAGGGGGASATTVEANLGSTPAWQGKFTITDGTISPTSKVLCWQAPGPYTGKGSALSADEGTMDPLIITTVVPGSGTAVAYWKHAAGLRPYTIPNPGAGDRPAVATIAGIPRRADDIVFAAQAGRVKGNVKFSYMVL